MKRVLMLVCATAGLFAVLFKPVNAYAGSSTHETKSVDYSYFLGSVTTTYDWDYIYGDKITFSAANSTTTGLAISASTSKYSETDATHKFKTVVNRGITIGVSAGTPVGGTAGGDLVWVTDVFYGAVTYKGKFLLSHDPSFE